MREYDVEVRTGQRAARFARSGDGHGVTTSGGETLCEEVVLVGLGA